METIVREQIDRGRIEDIVRTAMWKDLWIALAHKLGSPNKGQPSSQARLIGVMCMAAERAAMQTYDEGMKE